MSDINNEVGFTLTAKSDKKSSKQAGREDREAYQEGWDEASKKASRTPSNKVFDKRLAEAKKKGGRWWTTLGEFKPDYGGEVKPRNLKKYVEALRPTQAMYDFLAPNKSFYKKEGERATFDLYEAQIKEFEKMSKLLESTQKNTRKTKNENAEKARKDAEREEKHQRTRERNKREAAEDRAESAARKAEKDAQREKDKAEKAAQKKHDMGLAGRVFYATDIAQRKGSVYSKDILSHMGDYYKSLEQMTEREANLAYGHYKEVSRADLPKGEEASLIAAGLTRVNGKIYDGAGSERFKNVMARIQTTGADTIFAKFKEKFDSLGSTVDGLKKKIQRLNAISFKDYSSRPLNFGEGVYATAHGLARGAGKAGRGAFGAGKKVAGGLWKFNKSLFSKYDDNSRFGKLDSFFGNRRAETNLGHFIRNASPLSKIFFKATNAVKRFGGQFHRAFRFKVIRQLVSRVITLIKEGFKNLDKYSEHMGTPFHKNVLRLTSSLLYLKNAFAAMVAPIVNALTPALERLMDTFAALANNIGAFFAAITGQTQFSAALKKTITTTQQAAGKLKDILGFDEINRLSGDTGGDQSADEMFEEWGEGSIFDTMRQFIENGEWEALGELLADKVNALVEQLKEKKIGKLIGEKLGGAIKVARSFLENLDFSNMGATLGTQINDMISGVDWTDVGRLIFRSFSGAVEFFAGLIRTLNWSNIGKAIGDLFTSVFNSATTWIRNIEWGKIGRELVSNIVDFIKGLSLGDIITAAFELIKSVIKGAIELIGGILGGLLDLLFPGFSEWFEELENKILGWMPDRLKKLLGLDKGKAEISVNGNVTMDMDPTTKENISALKRKVVDGRVDSNPSLGGIPSKFDDYRLHFDSMKDVFMARGAWNRAGQTVQVSYGTVTSSGGSYTPHAASGGTFNKGQLFIANEAGPELIGNLNGKSSVTNYDQFTQSVIDANSMVVAAVMEVVKAVNNKDLDVYMDSQKVGQSVTQYQNNMARRFGY